MSATVVQNAVPKRAPLALTQRILEALEDKSGISIFQQVNAEYDADHIRFGYSKNENGDEAYSEIVIVPRPEIGESHWEVSHEAYSDVHGLTSVKIYIGNPEGAEGNVIIMGDGDSEVKDPAPFFDSLVGIIKQR